MKKHSILLAAASLSLLVGPAHGAILIDNSGVTASASTTISTASREPIRAVNGDGLIFNGVGGEENDPAKYEHDAGTSGFGENINWMTSNASGSRTTGWFIADLGAVYALDQVSFFNFNPSIGGGGSGNEDRGVSTGNVWYSTTGAGANSNGNDSAFVSSTFTQLGGLTNFTIAPSGDTNQTTPDTLNFGGASAQWVAIEILSNHGDGNFVGIGELQFFAVPEPSTFALGAMALAGLALRRRR